MSTPKTQAMMDQVESISLTITAPAQMPLGSDNEMKLLGTATWLWSHSEEHRGASIEDLASILFPVISQRQCLIFHQENKPVGYVSWALMDESAEQRYLSGLNRLLKPADWLSGDRAWMVDVIFPFGHLSPSVLRQARSALPIQWCRFLQHRAQKRGATIKHFYVDTKVMSEANRWFNEHPPMAPIRRV